MARTDGGQEQISIPATNPRVGPRWAGRRPGCCSLVHVAAPTRTAAPAGTAAAAKKAAVAKKISHTDDNPIMFRGRKLNVKTIRMLRSAERGLGERLVITQGSVNSSVQASAGTHDGGGVFDVSVRAGGARRQRKVRVLSRAGFAAWHRLCPVNGPRRQVSRRAFDTWRPASDR